jgi:hypothetical protein
MRDRLPFFDEMLGSGEAARDPYASYHGWFSNEDLKDLRKKSTDAEAFFRRTGITFNVYGAGRGRRTPDPLRHRAAHHLGARMGALTRGIEQRVRAINAFLHDIYHRQEILRAGRIPVDLIARNEAFLPQMIGVARPATSTPISSASTWCAPARTSSSCWRTTPARRRASPTCWRTAKRCCRCSRSCSPASRCSRFRTTRSTCAARWPPARRRTAPATPVVAC